MNNVKHEEFNAWLSEPITRAFVESVQQMHYASLVEQAMHVAANDMAKAQMTVGRLAMLDEMLALLQARPAAPKVASAYPEAEDAAANDEDKYRDPATIATGRNYVWTRHGLNG